MYNVRLMAAESKLRFWTFTLPVAMHPVDGAAMWRDLSRELVRSLGFRGVRVFELHPGGHGLHVHVCTPDWIDVNAVRMICRRMGWGRIDVEVFSNEGDSCGEYLAKYLSKQIKAWRGYPLKGVRWWAVFGKMPDKVRVCDCSIESPRRRIWDGIPSWVVAHIMGVAGPDPKEVITPMGAHAKRVLGAAKESFLNYWAKGGPVDCSVRMSASNSRRFNHCKMWLVNRVYFNFSSVLECFDGSRDWSPFADLRRLCLGFDLGYLREVAFQNVGEPCPL